MGMVVDLFRHPDEFFALWRMRRAANQASNMVSSQQDPDLRFCYIILQDVSRSFAMVIQQLPLQLRDAVCLFYVILRALDTVEDDMSIQIDTKVPILKAFHEHIYDPTWKFVCGEKHYKKLMEGFEHVANAFLHLPDGYQDVIADITKKMGAGMAKFIVKEVETIGDYDEYCHYVAGLVGCGLSRLFAESGWEDLASDSLSNSMGLFLQKVNVTRDYLEDINELPAPRMFWPREIWGKYGNSLEDFKEEDNEAAAVKCLNNMIIDALRHATDSLQYMSALKDSSIIRFCAIPQIMAIATLVTCYNNAEVFKGVVKIRRGLTAKIMDRTKSVADVYDAFHDFISILDTKIDTRDPSATQTLRHVDDIIKTCRSSGLLSERRRFSSESLKDNSRIITIQSKAVHELLLGIGLIILFLIMLPIVWHK